ncbi:MAG: hypothetical protein K2O78_08795, partial [Muribaculaceae bacterium]|nr:hypothetical protein [Muribaculaceae bacterium]MDE7081735.1 hypothetical protein [Muribaculaceae bacterium]
PWFYTLSVELSFVSHFCSILVIVRRGAAFQRFRLGRFPFAFAKLEHFSAVCKYFLNKYAIQVLILT